MATIQQRDVKGCTEKTVTVSRGFMYDKLVIRSVSTSPLGQRTVAIIHLTRDNAREFYDAIGAEMGFVSAPVVDPAPEPVDPAPEPVAKKRSPNGAQAYKGNGNHKWEAVTEDPKGAGATYRLRVAGGFVYRTVSYAAPNSPVVAAQSTTFVPMPDVVGYAI